MFMILRMPEYCGKFKCIADRCSDNCCIGWEIDIDEHTAVYYDSVGGEFGERLKCGISCMEPRAFILGKDERCPFLNSKNLCDIILSLGEDKLCGICTEHPRYYEWFEGVKEGGIGLCCEEAARIILSADKPSQYTETEIPDEDTCIVDVPLYVCLLEARGKILAHIENESVPLHQRMCDILDYGEKLQTQIDNGEYDVPNISPAKIGGTGDISAILDMLKTLEPIDEKWLPYLQKIEEKIEAVCNNKNDFLQNCGCAEKCLRNAAEYFVWRYFMKGTFDGEILSRVKLAAVSVALLRYMYCCEWLENGTLAFEACAMLAKNYSKEIEYSEENLNAILDAAYDLSAMDSRELKGLFA